MRCMENRRPLLESMVWPCYTGVFPRVLRGWYWNGLRCTRQSYEKLGAE